MQSGSNSVILRNSALRLEIALVDNDVLTGLYQFYVLVVNSVGVDILVCISKIERLPLHSSMIDVDMII